MCVLINNELNVCNEDNENEMSKNISNFFIHIYMRNLSSISVLDDTIAVPNVCLKYTRA